VIATQNPVEHEGTYPLPESQLDRFLLRLRLGHLDPEHEVEVVAREDGHRLLDGLQPVAGRDDLLAARRQIDAVRCAPELCAFMVELANRTRRAPATLLGVSTRGAQALHRACRTRALLHGRDFVVPDDVRALLLPAFGHRLHLRDGGEPDAVLHEILATTAMPD